MEAKNLVKIVGIFKDSNFDALWIAIYNKNYWRNLHYHKSFHNLNHKVRALKKDGVKAQQMVCNMAIFKNISGGRTIAKNLGVDKWFLYKVMKKRCKLLNWSFEHAFVWHWGMNSMI